MTLLAIMMGKIDTQAEQACETARRADHRAKECIVEARTAVQEGLHAVRLEAQRYTEEQCTAVKEELQQAIETVRRETMTAMDAVRREVEGCRAELATLHSGMGAAEADVCGWVEHCDLRSYCPRRDSVASAPAFSVQGYPPISSPNSPLSHSSSPPRCTGSRRSSPSRHPAFPLHATATSPRHPLAPRQDQPSRRKPSEFDGKVAWEAYLAQFELLANAQAWDEDECALQLVSSLRGAAFEVLAHLTLVQRTSYTILKLIRTYP
ncbi:hypothetical protein E2C01_041159 [Portunus trituberculatus]|uniref:Uncharacterized protein n=1 Tax=Portunus trituberculatus TaxID=210409 RepID=A0A5B7FSS3_PORTR|nr:hypothetical protein [Portunus trituberculatus]